VTMDEKVCGIHFLMEVPLQELGLLVLKMHVQERGLMSENV
jgi:hypothetical protein